MSVDYVMKKYFYQRDGVKTDNLIDKLYVKLVSDGVRPENGFFRGRYLLKKYDVDVYFELFIKRNAKSVKIEICNGCVYSFCGLNLLGMQINRKYYINDRGVNFILMGVSKF